MSMQQDLGAVPAQPGSEGEAKGAGRKGIAGSVALATALLVGGGIVGLLSLQSCASEQQATSQPTGAMPKATSNAPPPSGGQPVTPPPPTQNPSYPPPPTLEPLNFPSTGPCCRCPAAPASRGPRISAASSSAPESLLPRASTPRPRSPVNSGALT